MGALDSSEEEISKQFTRFSHYLSEYAKIDEQVYRIYRSQVVDDENYDEIVDVDEKSNKATKINYASWLATENVIMAFFAAISQFSSSEAKSHRVGDSIYALITKLNLSQEGSDPLGLEIFEQLRTGNNPRRVNIGLATRKLLTNGFKEFFRESGEMPLSECWKLGAE